MSLTRKITDEMAALAYRIIKKSADSSDEKVRKMVAAYNDLDRLLKKAQEVETP